MAYNSTLSLEEYHCTAYTHKQEEKTAMYWLSIHSQHPITKVFDMSNKIGLEILQTCLKWLSPFNGS